MHNIEQSEQRLKRLRMISVGWTILVSVGIPVTLWRAPVKHDLVFLLCGFTMTLLWTTVGLICATHASRSHYPSVLCVAVAWIAALLWTLTWAAPIILGTREWSVFGVLSFVLAFMMTWFAIGATLALHHRGSDGKAGR